MALLWLLISLFFLYLHFGHLNAFASIMTRAKHCNSSFLEGAEIMGQLVKRNDAYRIAVYRGTQKLSVGDFASSSEILFVSIEPTITEFVFEISSGKFTTSECNGKRSTSKNATLITPEAISNLTISALWAKSFSAGVKVTRNFTLTHKSYISSDEL